MPYTLHEVPEEQFVKKSVEVIVPLIHAAMNRHAFATIGLSGGSTPKPIYEALGKEPIDWTRVRVFLVDERYVPADHPESNQRLIRETLLRHANIPEENLVFPDTTLPIEACMEHYDGQLRMLIDGWLPDLGILGMGSDGHIASLFPPLSDLAMGDERLLLHTTTDYFAIRDRITISLNFVAAIQQPVILLRGTEKKHTWETMLQSKEGTKRWPLKAVLETSDATVITLW